MPYTHAQLFKPFKKILTSLGIDAERYSLKELRHTTGSIMNIKGADPMAIKDQLRHTDFKTTQDYYIGSDIEYQREQVEKLALERPKGGGMISSPSGKVIENIGEKNKIVGK